MCPDPFTMTYLSRVLLRSVTGKLVVEHTLFYVVVLRSIAFAAKSAPILRPRRPSL